MNNQMIEINSIPDDAEIAQFEYHQRDFWIQHLSGNKRIMLVDDDDRIIWPTGMKLFIGLFLVAGIAGVVLNFITIIGALAAVEQRPGASIFSALLSLLGVAISASNALNCYYLLTQKSRQSFSLVVLGYIVSVTGVLAALLFAVVLSDYFPYMSDILPEKLRGGWFERFCKKLTTLAGKLIDRFSL